MSGTYTYSEYGMYETWTKLDWQHFERYLHCCAWEPSFVCVNWASEPLSWGGGHKVPIRDARPFPWKNRLARRAPVPQKLAKPAMGQSWLFVDILYSLWLFCWITIKTPEWIRKFPNNNMRTSVDLCGFSPPQGISVSPHRFSHLPCPAHPFDETQNLHWYSYHLLTQCQTILAHHKFQPP